MSSLDKTQIYIRFVQQEPPPKSGAGCVRGDFQARFCERLGVKFPLSTRSHHVVQQVNMEIF